MTYVIFIATLLMFMYLLLEDTITKYLDKPSYSKEELDTMAKKRALKLKRARLDDWNLVENEIHIKTGLKDDKDLKLIIGSCTSCHSAKIITQNRATREGWKKMIRWMQATQGLPDLGTSESAILGYLAKHYAPIEIGRRPNLDVKAIEWYVLNLDSLESGR